MAPERRIAAPAGPADLPGHPVPGLCADGAGGVRLPALIYERTWLYAKPDRAVCGAGVHRHPAPAEPDRTVRKTRADAAGRRAAQRPGPPAAPRRGRAALRPVHRPGGPRRPAPVRPGLHHQPHQPPRRRAAAAAGPGRGVFHRKAHLLGRTDRHRPVRPAPRRAEGVCGGADALVRHHAGPQTGAENAAPLLCPGALLLLPAGLAPRGGLPHGVQRPPGAGRRGDHRPDP